MSFNNGRCSLLAISKTIVFVFLCLYSLPAVPYKGIASSEDFVIALQERLGDSCEVYANTTKAIHEFIGEMHAFLSLKDGEVSLLISVSCGHLKVGS
jgi:hypothetical protein